MLEHYQSKSRNTFQKLRTHSFGLSHELFTPKKQQSIEEQKFKSYIRKLDREEKERETQIE